MPARPRRAIALAAAIALVATIPTTAFAQFYDMKETSKSTFTLVPEERLVRAHAIVSIVNQKKPIKSKGPCKNAPRRTCTTTTRYYLEGWGPIHTPPDAVDVVLGGKKVETLHIGTNESGSTWFARFPRLFHKKKQTVDVAFDMLDGGPGAQTDTRVTDTYAHFCWYPETVDSGTARAVLPAGWAVRAVGDPVKIERTAAATIVSTTKKKDPGGTLACLDTYDPAALVRSHVLAPGGQLVTLDAWPTDRTWSEGVAELIGAGLPTLEHTIGTSMPFTSLRLQEVARANAFGHATDLDPDSGSMLLDEDLDFDAATLSALARTWFDDGSIADPWLAEGLTLWAGLSSAGYTCPDPGAYPIEGAAPDLREWRVSHVPAGVEPMLPVWQATTACNIVQEVADLIGPARMRTVIASLREGTRRYGDPADMPADRGPADWTDWLDAVDELGLVTARVGDLGTAERAITAAGAATAADMAGRLPARSLYHDTLAAMDGQALPDYVETLMEEWAFEAAVPAIARARRLFDAIDRDPTLDDGTRSALLGVFERADSATALEALEQALESGV